MPPSASVITYPPHIISKFQTLHRTTSNKDPPYVFPITPTPKIFHNSHIGVILDMKIEGVSYGATRISWIVVAHWGIVHNTGCCPRQNAR